VKTKEEIELIINNSRELGCPWVEVDGVKYPTIKVSKPVHVDEPDNPEIASGPGAEFTDEEILFYATPFFDELQEAKEIKLKHAEEEREFRGTV
jgi:hypothetical protein